MIIIVVVKIAIDIIIVINFLYFVDFLSSLFGKWSKHEKFKA